MHDVVPLRPPGQASKPDIARHVPYVITPPPSLLQRPEEERGIAHWTHVNSALRKDRRAVNPRWYEIMASRGKKGYIHHLLEPGRMYRLMLVPGTADHFPNLDELTNDVIYHYGTQDCGYEDPRAALIPQLCAEMSEAKQMDLRARGFEYVAAIHDRMEVLDLHERMWFRLAGGPDAYGTSDIYFDPQYRGRWKPRGLFAFCQKVGAS